MIWPRPTDRAAGAFGYSHVAVLLLFASLGIGGCAGGGEEPEIVPVPEGAPRVVLETSFGNITIGLYQDRAPKTVANFLAYVDSGFYDGTLFHRVIPGFMIQGGGFLPGMKQKPTGFPIASEADNGLHNLRGTVAMARTMNPDSATSQFFINHVDMPRLDYRPPVEAGYTVFGLVEEGMEVVDSIAEVETGTVDGHQNVPVEDVLILRARRLDAGR
ncbi:MAG: peptidylprolyl isomerase [Acidobacteriota bacterium]